MINRTVPVSVVTTLVVAMSLLLFTTNSTRAETLFTGCGGETVAPTNYAYEQEVAELTNAHRAENDLPPLKLNSKLSDAARYHSADMQQDTYFNHASHDRNGTGVVKVCDWFKRVEVYYNGGYMAENIASGYPSPASVVQGWINSPGHLTNILGANYKELGVGYANAYWTQDFGEQSGVDPLIINSEAARTTVATVQLYMYGNWQEMRLRNDGDAWGDWQPFQNDLNWTLNNSFGMHTVSVEMRSGATTATSSDEIEFVDPSAVPTPTNTRVVPPTRTPLPTRTPSPTRTPISTNTPVATSTATPTQTPTATATATATATPSPTPTPTPDGMLYFSAPRRIVEVGQPFDLSVVAMSSTALDHADVYLDFDTQALRTLSMTVENTLKTVQQQNVNNVTGEIILRGEFASGGISGTLPLAALHMQAHNPHPCAVVSVSRQGTRTSNLWWQGQPQLTQLRNAHIQVISTTAPMLGGQIELQGRPLLPNPRWQVPLQIDLITAISRTLATSHTVSSNDCGFFQATDVLPGDYAISIKGEHTLRRVISTTIQGGLSVVDVGTLIEGDIVEDNRVNVLDFSALAMLHGACVNQTRFLTQSDLNGDGCTTDEDVSLLKANFGAKGDGWPGLTEILSPTNAATSLEMVLTTINNKKAGEQLLVELMINGALTNTINAGALYLTFDPSKVRILELMPNSTFSITAGSEIDNATGDAYIAAGRYGEGVTMPFAFATIRIEVLSDFDSTPIMLALSEERRSDFAAGGRSLLPAEPTQSLFTIVVEQTDLSGKVYLPLVQR